MNREETHALFAQGRYAWNAWADGMLAQKAEMEKGGTWQMEMGENPINAETTAWQEAAVADFSNRDNPHTFAEPTDFWKFKFPGTARFGGATFTGDAGFDGATFTGEAVFNGATFTGDAVFRGATFGATKDRVPTLKSTYFSGARFLRSAQFSTAHFYGPVFFDDAIFTGEPDFSSIKSDVGFTLSGAYFARVPNMLQAELHREPRLDNVRIGVFESRWLAWVPRPFPQLNWRPWHVVKADCDEILKTPGGVALLFPIGGNYHRFRLPFTADRDAPAKIREMKNYANEGRDSVRELDFHALEVRKSRFVTDYPWHLRFWFGILYATISNFGRSLLRPLALWGVLLLASAAVYLLNSPVIADKRAQLAAPAWIDRRETDADLVVSAWFDSAKCATFPESQPGVGRRSLAPDVAKGTTLAGEALHLSFLNASVIGSFSGDNARRTYGCLYGLESDASGNTFPIVPNFVADLGAVQRLISAVLIFLFGMAVRNMLKLK